MIPETSLKKIGFGGGCHWCTEAVFQSLKGVELVEQGWIASIEPYSSFSEGVVVHFNLEQIDLFTSFQFICILIVALQNIV